MKKEIWAITIFLFIFILFSIDKTCSQTIHLPSKVEEAVVNCCPVCKENISDSNKLVISRNGFSAALLAYHNSIILLKKGDIENCYQYLNVCVNNRNNSPDSIVTIATFLKAKILYYKGLYKEALQIYTPLLNSNKIGEEVKENICTNIAEIYLEQSDFTKALHYFTIWDTAYKSVSNLNSIRSTYCNIGLCYIHTNQFAKAHDYFEQSVSIAKEQQDTALLATLYENIANQYYSQYLDKKALPYFLQGLSFAKQSANIETQMNIYGSLSVVEENRKHYFKALDYLKHFVVLNDSLFKRDDIYNLVQKEKSLAIREKDHQVQIVQQANRLQSLEIAKNNLEISKQKQLLFLSIALTVTFLSFFLFAFYAYRQKNKQNLIISAQREELDALNHTKDQLFSIVAHDLRSPVQTMKVALLKLRTALQDKNISHAEQVSGEVENISNRTYSLLNNLLYWALSQTGQLHFTKDKLNVKRLVDQVLYDYAPVAATKNIGLETCVAESLYCKGDINTVKIILRNLIDNAIKFSEPLSAISISGHEAGEECVVSVTDGGKGIDAVIIQALQNKNTKRVNNAQMKGQSTGIGLWLVKTMAERNGGSLQIVPKPKGTEINIHLPRYQNHE